jgi:iron complex outermembrane receptor protein
LLSDGIHHGTATYELGNIFLLPEKATNIAYGINYTSTNKKLSVQVDVYHNSIQNFIYQQPMPDSPVLTIAGAFPKIEYKQTNAALKGMDASVYWQLSKHVLWLCKYAMLRAINTNTNDWLIWMPADRMTNEITYSFNTQKKFHDSYISADMQQVWRQNKVPSNKFGRQDYKDAPSGYMLINVHAATTVQVAKNTINIGFGVTNIFNTVYRDYLNSFRYFTDEMGRNVSLNLKIPLSHQIKN